MVPSVRPWVFKAGHHLGAKQAPRGIRIPGGSCFGSTLAGRHLGAVRLPAPPCKVTTFVSNFEGEGA